MTAGELVRALLEATPGPDGLADDELLPTFQAILVDRQVLLDGVSEPLALADADRSLVAELEARAQVWHAALDAARIRLGAQRVAAVKLRAYER